MMEPVLAHGKVCYMEIPANDLNVAVAFYRDIFDWHVRTRDDGSSAFDDAVGQVSGTWIAMPPEGAIDGTFLHIMVRDVDVVLDAIVARGGAVVERPGRHLPEITARFADPSGNRFSVYQERSLASHA